MNNSKILKATTHNLSIGVIVAEKFSLGKCVCLLFTSLFYIENNFIQRFPGSICRKTLALAIFLSVGWGEKLLGHLFMVLGEFADSFFREDHYWTFQYFYILTF